MKFFGILAVIALVALLAVSPVGSTRAAAPGCTGGNLSGTFAEVPGSAGAGSVSYALRLTNTSAQACFVTGIPVLQLLDKGGKPLPTKTTPAQPGKLTAVRVELASGKTANATARFSGSVPGKGETVKGPCEGTAYKLRVTPTGGGTLLAPVRPPTPVCEHGALSMSVLKRG